MSKRAKPRGLGKFRQEVNMADVVELEHVFAPNCDLNSEKMSEAQRKGL